MRLAVALLVAVASVLGAVAVGADGPTRAQAAPGKQFNVVFIVTDDQESASVTPETMPNVLKQLAGNGTTFDNSIVSTPQCCPSRATTLTGQYAHNHGVVSNSPGYPDLRGKHNVLPKWLSRAGYRTGFAGKFLLGYAAGEDGPAPGWDEWYAMTRPYDYRKFSLNENGKVRKHLGYLTNTITRKATGMVRRFSRSDDPFYLHVGYWAPHADNFGNRTPPCFGTAVPAPGDERAFDDTPLPKPPSYNEANVSDKPSFIQTKEPITDEQERSIERDYRCRLASLLAVDRGVKAIVSELRERRELGRTLIVFTSDNGFIQGEHRVRAGKTYPYEESLRVPLIVRPPASLGGPRGASVDARVANIDLPPTMLAFAGARPCVRQGRCRVMDGRSLRGLLAGQTPGWAADRGLLVEWDDGAEGAANAPCKYAGIWTAEHFYVEHDSVTGPNGRCFTTNEREFYELGPDPFQLQNRYPTVPASDRGETEAALAQRLEVLRDCAGTVDGARRGRPGCE